MKRSSLPRVIYLPDGPVSNWQRYRRPTKRMLAVMGFSGLVLASCTTFGTNINGSFSCGAAGAGSCAPATVIDDRALAEISGDSRYVPAGPYRPAPQHVAPVQVAQAALPAVEAVPGGQKVLRIVFPAHVDRAGRYHETSIVRAVVDNGAWVQASTDHRVSLAQTVNLTVNPDVFSQLGHEPAARERPVSEAGRQIGYNDPAMPSPEAVMAARSRVKVKAVSPPVTASAISGAALANRPAFFNPSVED